MYVCMYLEVNAYLGVIGAEESACSDAIWAVAEPYLILPDSC